MQQSTHTIDEMVKKINKTPFSYMGEKIYIHAFDGLWSAGEDTIKISFMHKDEKGDVTFKDMLVFDRLMFKNDAEECLRQIFNFIDRKMTNSTYGEVEEEI